MGFRAQARSRDVLAWVAGEHHNVRLSAARPANLRPGLWEVLPGHRLFQWNSRERGRRLLGKGGALPRSLLPRCFLSSLSLVGLDLRFNTCPCLRIVEFFCVPFRIS
jgi:hypothetical protein